MPENSWLGFLQNVDCIYTYPMWWIFKKVWMHLAAVKTEQMQDKTWSRNKAFLLWWFCEIWRVLFVSQSKQRCPKPRTLWSLLAAFYFQKAMCTSERYLCDTCRGPPDHMNKLSFEKTENFIIGWKMLLDWSFGAKVCIYAARRGQMGGRTKEKRPKEGETFADRAATSQTLTAVAIRCWG